MGIVWRIYTRGGIFRSYDSSIFSFLRNLLTVFYSPVPICIPTNSVQWFPFLHILTNMCCVPFGDSHSDKCEVVSHCGFDCGFF